jgi:hypothetical protein
MKERLRALLDERARLRLRGLARRVAAAVAWLAIVAGIALGGAGIVSGADHPPGSGARPELTYRRDLEVEAALDPVSAELVELAEQVSALGVQARGALSALNGDQVATAEAAIAEGDRLLVDMRVMTTRLNIELANIPYVSRTDTGLLVSDAVVARHAALVEALRTTSGLQSAWNRLTTGSVTAIRLSTLLATHDDQVIEAAGLGRAARYDEAIEILDDAIDTVAAARAMRDQLANTVDVTVLDEWLDRIATYDAALRRMYAAYANVGATVTDELHDAIAAEEVARRNLPPDPRGMVAIMAEIGRSGMNGAVIGIEEARGRLQAAIEASS